MNKADLLTVASKLNSSGIRYGLGGSSMLYAYGLADLPQDIDLVVALEDADRAIQLLEELGPSIPVPPKPPCCSRRFVHYVIGASEVDLIAGFRAEHREGIYEWIWDDSTALEQMTLDHGVTVPLTSLEDWLILYALMGRKLRVESISRYFREKGSVQRHILSKAMEQPLPEDIRSLIQYLV